MEKRCVNPLIDVTRSPLIVSKNKWDALRMIADFGRLSLVEHDAPDCSWE